MAHESEARSIEAESPYLTLAEAAVYSRYSTRQLQRWISSGALRRLGTRKKTLVRKSELEEVLASRDLGTAEITE